MEFSRDFIFGTATSAYQIEGAASEDGRTSSIWDDFCKEAGRVDNNDNGDIACDHYHLFKEDVKLMAELGIDSYRLSISWPRIFPEKGRYNPEGMRFYQELLKELISNNIKPMVTLYHWDMPSWAQALGGWSARESVDWFSEYAGKCFEELDEYVHMWVTHNEPWCVSFLSNYEGIHAPGKKDLYEALRVAHHVLLSHGRAVQLYRGMNGGKQIGIALNLTAVYANTDSLQDQLAANNMDVYRNRYFLDPLFKQTYPFDMMNFAAGCVPDFRFIEDGDMEMIAERCDFFSFNYYSRARVEYNGQERSCVKELPAVYAMTHLGWEVYPEGLYDIIARLREEYTDLPIYITENGAAFKDVVTEDNRVHDVERTDYIRMHLKEVARANENGMNVAGYYVWSLIDNFEWSLGYDKRFGLVYCNYDNQDRIRKDSFYFYQDVINKREI